MHVDFFTHNFDFPENLKKHVYFYGYPDYSTKDREHLDRSNEVIGLEVKFDADTVITLGKDKFLSNRVNKSKFIKFSRGTLDSC